VSVVNPCVIGVSRRSNVNYPRIIIGRYTANWTNLGEQSTDKGKPSNETSPDSETHGTTAVAGPSGARRSTAEVRGSVGEKYKFGK